MFTNKSKRVLVTAALAATLGAAVPAEAAGWRESPSDLLDGLVAWAVNIWELAGEQGSIYPPEGGYVDPNGGGPRPGCESNPAGCNNPKDAVVTGDP